MTCSCGGSFDDHKMSMPWPGSDDGLNEEWCEHLGVTPVIDHYSNDGDWMGETGGDPICPCREYDGEVPEEVL